MLNYLCARLKLRFIGDHVKFIWTDSDGGTFGRQTLEDGNLKFATEWLNHEHSWSARLHGRSNQTHAYIFYLALQVRHSATLSFHRISSD